MSGGRSFSNIQIWPAFRFLICLLLVIYLIAPMIVVGIISFSSAKFLSFPPPGFSFQWYVKIWEDPAWANSIMTSVKIMIPTGIMATVLGTMAAVALSRTDFLGKNVIFGLLIAPLMVPVIIVAAAFYGIFVSWRLNGTLTGLIIAHTVLTVPFVLSTVLSTLQMVDQQLEKAALTLGAPPLQAFRRVTLPLIMPAVLSGLLFAMVISFDELVVSLFISGPIVRPVTVQMWSDIRGAVDPTIAAIGMVMFGFSLSVLFVDSIVRRGQQPVTRTM